jgi:alkylation response protein AidB-like acyl-CoA dehydrogenase
VATETMEIRQMARQFAQSDVRPHVEKWDHDGAIPPETIAQIAELGFFGMLTPEEQGGMAFDTATYAAAIEELAWGEAGLALLVAAANVAGSDDVQDARLEMLADDTGGMFLVPATASGERVSTLGFRTVEIIHSERRRTATQSTDAALIGVAAIAIGIAQAALEHARAYADEREQFGTKLRDFEGLQYKLAEMATRIAAARALLQAVCHEDGSGSGSGSGSGASMAKVFASEAAMWVTTQAVQIFGGYGYMRDYPVEKLMRDAKATEMLEGSNESLRVTIARNLYH